VFPSQFMALGSFRGWLSEHFARRTTSGRYIAEVDGLRFFSIAMVVLYHLVEQLISMSHVPAAQQSWVARYAALGRFGPHLFFVISGFVLALPFAQARLGNGPTVRLKRYYLRRLTRIEPPYFVAMTLMLVAAVVIRHRPLLPLLAHYATGLMYANNILLHASNQFVSVAWSLEVEVQFYLIAPLLAMVFLLPTRRMRMTALFIAAAATLSWRPLRVGTPPYLPYYIELFAAGFAMAEIYAGGWNERQPRVLWDVIGVGSLLGLILVWFQPDRMVSQAAFPILALALFCAAFAGRWMRFILRSGPLTVVGGMCYTIYLIHLPIINNTSPVFQPLAARLGVATAFLVSFIVVVAAVGAASCAFFMLIERPTMREDWPHRTRVALRQFFTRRSPVIGQVSAE
jgi:peptidoglycan/LPS O-acetylase OafA/YrhL